MEKSFYSIYKTFFKIGTLLLGGGYVILPLLSSELADKKKRITQEELSEYYALSSSLPGVIAVNTAIFTGRKLAGTKGAVAAITGIITPSFLAIILLAAILSEIVNYTSVQNIFWGVSIGVIALLVLAVREMWSKCVFDKFSFVIYLLALILAYMGKISPAYIITGAVIAGMVRAKITAKTDTEETQT